MKSRAFTEKRKTDSVVTENIESGVTMKKRRKHRAGKYFINSEVNVQDSEDYIITVSVDGETILDVQCGTNTAKLTLEKLWQGSKGQCIYFQGSWLTPNEFQYVSGRETAKDWKRSIRHQGKSIKLLLSKGYIKVTTEGLASDESKRIVKRVANTKQRGRGRRRKSTNKKTTVLVDNTCHLNVNEINHKQKDESLANGTESTDESNDGNETDDTIENYYPETGYSVAKKNIASVVETCPKQDNFPDDSIKVENDEYHTEKENIVDDITGDKEHQSTNSGPGTALDDVDSDSQEDDTGSHVEEISTDGRINHFDNKLSSYTEDNKIGILKAYNKGPKCDEVKPENKEDSTFDSVSVNGCGMIQACSEEIKECTKINLNGGDEKPKYFPDDPRMNTPLLSTEMKTDVSDGLSTDEETSTIKVTCEETPALIPQGTDEGNLESDDLPPILFPQTAISNNATSEDQYPLNNDNSMTIPTRPILSLPLKRFDNPGTPRDKNGSCKYPEKLSSAVGTPNHADKCNVSNDGGITSVFKQSDISLDTQARKDALSILFDNTDSAKDPKPNKRKRSLNHIKKTQSPCIPNSERPTISPKETSDQYSSGSEGPHTNDRLEIVNCIENKLLSNNAENKGCGEIYSESNSPPFSSLKFDDNETMKIPYNSPRNDHHIIEKFQMNDREKCRDLKLKIFDKEDRKSLINLSATVPRKNGDAKDKSRLQTTYDEYMRRLEASHIASMSWNPYFPYFQFPGHPNGVPFSPFSSPYPPLLTPKMHDSDIAQSPKTKVDSPLQSPYTATSPPSFESFKLPISISSGNKSIKESISDVPLLKSFNYPCSSSSSTSCLTIQPAHSVRPDSICSNMKGKELNCTVPLDLSVKKRKHEEIDEKQTCTDFNKNKLTDLRSFESRRDKKHKKLKHLWINKTDNDDQNVSQETCTCKGRNITDWSVDQVVRFVHQLDGCGPYAKLFSENKISGMTLHLLTTDHLTRGLGMKVGPAIVLSDAIEREVQNSRRRSMSCSYCSSLLRINANVCF